MRINHLAILLLVPACVVGNTKPIVTTALNQTRGEAVLALKPITLGGGMHHRLEIASECVCSLPACSTKPVCLFRVNGYSMRGKLFDRDSRVTILADGVRYNLSDINRITEITGGTSTYTAIAPGVVVGSNSQWATDDLSAPMLVREMREIGAAKNASIAAGRFEMDLGANHLKGLADLAAAVTTAYLANRPAQEEAEQPEDAQ